MSATPTSLSRGRVPGQPRGAADTPPRPPHTLHGHRTRVLVPAPAVLARLRDIFGEDTYTRRLSIDGFAVPTVTVAIRNDGHGSGSVATVGLSRYGALVDGALLRSELLARGPIEATVAGIRALAGAVAAGDARLLAGESVRLDGAGWAGIARLREPHSWGADAFADGPRPHLSWVEASFDAA